MAPRLLYERHLRSVLSDYAGPLTGTGPPVPHATTTQPGRPSQRSAELASSATEGAWRRDQRVLPGRIADLMDPGQTPVRWISEPH
jgi:hypothetical protein